MKELFFCCLILFLCSKNKLFAQQQKLPLPIFLQLIDSTKKIDINHATAFKHVELPKKFFNTFIGYIKDSSATLLPNVTSVVYYTFTSNNDKIINGDVYWNEQNSYIVFKVDGHVFVNAFSKEGVAQLKSIFKL